MTKRGNTKIRIGLVGCGRVSGQHFRAIQKQSEKCKLAGVCDIIPERAEKAARETGARAYTDYQRMLEEADLDAVAICTPSGLHPEHGIMAARRKINVITEKPMAVNLPECDQLISECSRQGVHLLVIKQNRFNQPVQLLKKALDEGRFGSVYGVFINVFWHRTQAYYDHDAWRGTWELDGGAFMNQGIHFIDAAQWLLGGIDRVAAITATQGRLIEAEDSGAAIMKFSCGAVGTINVSMLSEPCNREGSLMVMGEKGTVKIGGVALNQVDLWDFIERKPEDDLVRENNYQPQTVYGRGHNAYYHNVVEVLLGQSQPIADGNEGRKSLETVLAIYQAAESGRTIELPPSHA